MEDDAVAIATLSALAQPTRLAVFRLLVRNAPDGLPAGEVAAALTVPANTMSVHLGVLSRAGLIRSTRHSRSIVYTADLERLGRLVAFLLTDCCQGRAEICQPLMAELVACEA
ncbi:transcriptional regulator [Brevundimonas sp. LM2]|uniref:ArsR/SmtB family transcription factor n=1 Tax=Brevundimonas sp. LM2 TaxID=1938605 RepID=UPI000983F386|nr:helix-turn-helix domain-containing protein [Brevundimonas sp. LM2]AQR61006.1 transcriptional regulator [Brevundimonas sp. LM2]